MSLWTKNIPDTPGWYWYRHIGEDAGVISLDMMRYVREEDFHLFRFPGYTYILTDYDLVEKFYAHGDHLEFHGPVLPPFMVERDTENTLAVDFDGVVQSSTRHHRKGASHAPVRGAIAALQQLQQKGYYVYILTARNHLAPVRKWFLKWAPELADIEISNVKHPARAYIDDRAIRFTNWKDILHYF